MTVDFPAEWLQAFAQIVGPSGMVTDAADLETHLTEWRGLYRGSAPVMLRPRDVAQVAEVLRFCNARAIGVVPQGGNTGLVGGAIPHSRADAPQIIVSSGRMRRIRNLDAPNYTITAEAGCVLANLQDAAAAADRLFPLSLAAEGSCQLGGNISTNAGGTNVLRYGNARDLVLGLEVVLPDGSVYEGLRGLRKDNAGYDLKQLFIGAEGTLGFITAATCKLFPRPRHVSTALIALASVDAAVTLYGDARNALADGMNAFEIMNRLSLELVMTHIPGTRNPLESPSEWYVLLENDDADLAAFLSERMEQGTIAGAVVAQSEAQREAFWRIRHSISEAQKLDGAGIKHDISVPISEAANFIRRATSLVERLVPGCRVVAFGHLGDGNIHFNLNQPKEMAAGAFVDQWSRVSREVHALAADMGGSFSAEHGIGELKTRELQRLRGTTDLALMHAIKRALDPAGIMNPGKVLAEPEA